jgi:putative oxidoreductase
MTNRVRQIEGPQREPRSRSLQPVETPALIAARAILGGYFIYNGINHFVNREMLSQYAQSKGVESSDAAVTGSGLLALAGGLSILTGVLPKVGAGLLSTFLLGVSPRIHAFWREKDPQQRMQEMVNFTKNMALIGGALFAAAHPEPWQWAANSGGRMVAGER